MFQKDYILRQIELLSQGLAKMLFNKDTTLSVFDGIISETGELSGAEYLRYTLHTMLQDDLINDAEDLLFETIGQHPRPEYLGVALEFYEQLAQKSDDDLEACNFSREEVADGLAEIQKIFDLISSTPSEN